MFQTDLRMFWAILEGSSGFYGVLSTLNTVKQDGYMKEVCVALLNAHSASAVY
jgi:hypothetical protein